MTDERWKECKHHHNACACRTHAWEEKLEDLDRDRRRAVEWKDAVIAANTRYIAEIHELQAEVERLKALPTAAQERAAIVAWMNKQQRFPDVFPATYSRRIERGEHWPTEGEKL